MKINIIMPCDTQRLNLLYKTLDKYKEFNLGEEVEFIIVTRSIEAIDNIWSLNLKVIHYKWDKPTFSPVMAFNIGILNSAYDNVIITSPEVRPITNVIEQFNELGRGNYISQVFDCDPQENHIMSLVNTSFRAHPGMYWLAMYKKEDIVAINGWDNGFMDGYAYDDDDFSKRFVRAGHTFKVMNDITAEHLWHKRSSASGNDRVDLDHNLILFRKNMNSNVVRCENGLEQLKTLEI